jgi:hypothetical protein
MPPESPSFGFHKLGKRQHLTPKWAQILGIFTAFAFITSIVTTVRSSQAARAG